MAIARAEIKVGHVLDVLEEMPEQSIHAAITSPPYWGLRDYKLPPQDWNGWTGSLGLEPTIDLFLDHLVGVFDAVRRVLREDGALWVNIGDSYSTHAHGTGDTFDPKAPGARVRQGDQQCNRRPIPGLKHLDQCCIPERFKLRMIDAGWYCRSTIIWAKGISFCPEYSGSVMPESINGWRWERCRVNAGASSASNSTGQVTGLTSDVNKKGRNPDSSRDPELQAKWSDCPGCEKCAPHGGLVLRKGSWRPTSAFEYVYQFAKSPDYYCDAEAVREESGGVPEYHAQQRISRDHQTDRPTGANRIDYGERQEMNGRNLRNVWTINPAPFPEAHFATFPEALVEPIVKVSTSDKGVCPECGSPWARVVDTRYVKSPVHGEGSQIGMDGSPHGMTGMPRVARQDSTLGWRPTCGCAAPRHVSVVVGEPWEKPRRDPSPATVLDPFAGSGTTLLVARKLGRHSIGIELSQEYAAIAEKRLAEYAPLFAGAES